MNNPIMQTYECNLRINDLLSFLFILHLFFVNILKKLHYYTIKNTLLHNNVNRWGYLNIRIKIRI